MAELIQWANSDTINEDICLEPQVQIASSVQMHSNPPTADVKTPIIKYIQYKRLHK